MRAECAAAPPSARGVASEGGGVREAIGSADAARDPALETEIQTHSNCGALHLRYLAAAVLSVRCCVVNRCWNLN